MPRPPANRLTSRTERRRAPRYPLQVPLELEWGSARLQGRVRDISTSGMFIEITDPLWVGATFAAQLGSEPPLRVECSVRRVEPGAGMGVTFLGPGDLARVRIADLLESMEGK